MKAKWIGLVIVAAAVAAACGEGHAIFNVDVFSFMQGTGDDTLHYTVPGNTSGNVDNPPVEFQLLGGLGNSTVDTVTITIGADLDNNTGTGTVSYQIFFSDSQSTTYNGPPFLTANGNLTPGNTTPIVATATFSDSLFNAQSLWVGIRLGAAATTATALDGTMRLTALNLRIVLQDKF
jgi:hypothetical protein